MAIYCYPNPSGSGNSAYFCAGCDGPYSNTACYSSGNNCDCAGGAASVSPLGPSVNPGTIRPETWKQKQGKTMSLPLSSRFPVKPSARRAGGRKPQNAKLRRRRGRNFSGMNPVQQRPIGVNPSQGGFFAVPQDERNFGQQSALPYEEQLNFSHSNASGCGYSNMNHGHSNFGANTASTTWSGAQTNVGPQDRIFAGSYANGRRRR